MPEALTHFLDIPLGMLFLIRGFEMALFPPREELAFNFAKKDSHFLLRDFILCTELWHYHRLSKSGNYQ
jgi:hypothetical protein